jgi:hypothetical protein
MKNVGLFLCGAVLGGAGVSLALWYYIAREYL